MLANLSPGDLIACYEYTRPHPTNFQIGQWIAAQKSGDWWIPAPGEAHNRYRVWPDYPIVVLRVEKSAVIVTSSAFTRQLQTEGVRVPVTHVELLEPGYGLPELVKEECKVIPMAGRRNRKAAVAGQGALL